RRGSAGYRPDRGSRPGCQPGSGPSSGAVSAGLRIVLIDRGRRIVAAPVDAAQIAARFAFAATVVLSPFRARIELLARPSPPVYGDFTDVLLFWSDAALLLTLGLWLVSFIGRPQRVRLGPRFLAWSAAGLLAVAWLGVPASIDPGLSAYQAGRLLILALLGLYVLNEIERPADLLLPVGAMVAVQALVGLGQVLAQGSLGLGALGELRLSPSLPVSVVTAADGIRTLRAYGLTDHPNILGGLLVLGLLLVAGAFVAASADGRRTQGGRVSVRRVQVGGARVGGARVGGSRVGRARAPWNRVPWARVRWARVRWAGLALFGLGAAALLVTFSRSAWLALAVGFVVLAGMLAPIVGRAARRSVWRPLAAVLLCGAMVSAPFAVAFLPDLLARTDTQGPIATEARSLDERGAVAAATVAVAREHPVLGVGLGTLPLAIQAAQPHFPYDLQPASVVLLDAAAETGLLGGLLELALIVGPWVALVRLRRAWTPELAVASAALAAVTVVGFFDYYTWTYQAGRIWAWLVLGLWAAAYAAASAGSVTPAALLHSAASTPSTPSTSSATPRSGIRDAG
ncbi:MAG: O-antigen ligase family protein, partial [Candidatus Limnocylindrales bacterium]